MKRISIIDVVSYPTVDMVEGNLAGCPSFDVPNLFYSRAQKIFNAYEELQDDLRQMFEEQS